MKDQFYKISVGIPLFENPWGKWGKIALKMKVGDSILLKDEVEAQTFIRVLYRYKRRGSRRVLQDETYRVWRVR